MRTLLALFAALFILGAASMAPAPTADTTPATGLDGSSIHVYESPPNGTGGRGDHVVFYKGQLNLSNLGNINFNLWLGCDNAYNNWNNCITAVKMNVKSGSCVAFYNSKNYSSLLRTIYGTDTYLYALEGTSQDNKYSSIRWGDRKYVAGSGTRYCKFGSYD
jgi:hypothetical protein